MAELEARKESPEWISAKTLRNQFITISGMLNFAVDQEWLTVNSMVGGDVRSDPKSAAILMLCELIVEANKAISRKVHEVF